MNKITLDRMPKVAYSGGMTETTNSTYNLSDLAGCGDPSSIDHRGLAPDSTKGRTFIPSLGAVFLRNVEDAYSEAREDYPPESEGEWSDRFHELADSAVPVYTWERWRTFVDLAAWQENIDEIVAEDDDMSDRAGVALYCIASRLLDRLHGTEDAVVTA